MAVISLLLLATFSCASNRLFAEAHALTQGIVQLFRVQHADYPIESVMQWYAVG